VFDAAMIHLLSHAKARQLLATITHWPNIGQSTTKGRYPMATAKKTTAPTASMFRRKPYAAAKVTKPATKAPAKKVPVSKTAKAIAKLSASIAKLTERKDKLNAEINALRAQRTALKAPAAAPAAAAPKAAAPKKVAKAAKPAPKPAAKK
jgi:hypothetical protein